MQARADMKMDITEKITNVQVGAMQERADIKARLSVLESRLNNHK
jgi:hypothetical protein